MGDYDTSKIGEGLIDSRNYPIVDQLLNKKRGKVFKSFSVPKLKSELFNLN